MMPRRSCDETGALGPASAERLGRDRAQHPLPVSEGAQVALAMDAVEFKTGHLGDRQARLCDFFTQNGIPAEVAIEITWWFVTFAWTRGART